MSCALNLASDNWKLVSGNHRLSTGNGQLATGNLAREKYEDEVECLLSLWAEFFYIFFYQHLTPL